MKIACKFSTHKEMYRPHALDHFWSTTKSRDLLTALTRLLGLLSSWRCERLAWLQAFLCLSISAENRRFLYPRKYWYQKQKIFLCVYPKVAKQIIKVEKSGILKPVVFYWINRKNETKKVKYWFNVIKKKLSKILLLRIFCIAFSTWLKI